MKPTKGQALQHVRRVQNHWREFQELLSKASRVTTLFTTSPEDIRSPESQQGDSDEVLRMLDQWKAQFKQINEQISEGNLSKAWVSIPLYTSLGA